MAEENTGEVTFDNLNVTNLHPEEVTSILSLEDKKELHLKSLKRHLNDIIRIDRIIYSFIISSVLLIYIGNFGLFICRE